MELREGDAARQPPMSSTDDASASDDTEDIRTRRRALPLAHCGRAGANQALETFEYRPEELLIMATGTGSREAHLERVAPAEEFEKGEMVRGRALLTFLLLLAGSGQSAAQGGESVAPQPMQEGGRGFGDAISWFSFDDGLRAAEAQAMPALVVIHKSWCGACRSLGPAFAASAEITALASEFIMINVRDDEEPRDASWHPDGSCACYAAHTRSRPWRVLACAPQRALMHTHMSLRELTQSHCTQSQTFRASSSMMAEWESFWTTSLARAHGMTASTSTSVPTRR